MIRGSCLCGLVKYEISGAIEEMTSCHCSMCRKAHGAAFATFARANADEFRFSTGKEQIKRYRSSPPVERLFCQECGSNLVFLFDRMPEKVWVAAGSLDDDPGVQPSSNIFVGSKAPWFELTDDLPRFDQDDTQE